MRFVTNTPGSGTLGGAVAFTGRAGAQMRARSPRTQPRTPSQTNNRARVGALASAWRSLSASQREAWAEFAQGGQNGFNLFIQRNRNLQAIGAQGLTLLPAAPRTVPQFGTFIASAYYTLSDPVGLLDGFGVSFFGLVPQNVLGVVSATAILSPTRANLSRSLFRDVYVWDPEHYEGLFPFADYLAAWGRSQASGLVTFSVKLIDPQTGFAWPRLYATAPVTQPAWNQFPPYAVIIETEGQEAAAIPAQTIEIEGSPVAD
jgi:hypothetical protein